MGLEFGLLMKRTFWSLLKSNSQTDLLVKRKSLARPVFDLQAIEFGAFFAYFQPFQIVPKISFLTYFQTKKTD